MTADQLADEIVEIARHNGDCTHGAIISRFGDLVTGSLNLIVNPPNIAIAVGVSELLCDAMDILQAERPHRLELKIAHPFVASWDDTPMPVNMPWAGKKKPRNGRYAKPCFAPMLLLIDCEGYAEWEHVQESLLAACLS